VDPADQPVETGVEAKDLENTKNLSSFSFLFLSRSIFTVADKFSTSIKVYLNAFLEGAGAFGR
jgi:hypothetical protein